MLPGYTVAPIGTPFRPTGARPTPKNRLAAARPHRVSGPTPSSWVWLPSHLDYWYNNQFGCCVTTEEAGACACAGVFIDPEEVRRWASAHNVLNGAMLDEVLDDRARDGFQGDGNLYLAGGKLAIDPTDWNALTNAISKGPVKMGMASSQLQGVVGQQNGWILTGARKDTSEDHSTGAWGFGTIAELAAYLKITLPSGVDGSLKGIAVFTWDTVGIMDYQSFQNVTGETWLRDPTNIVKGSNKPTPDPVWTPTPTPPPPPVPPTPTPAPDVHPTLDITGNAHLFGLHIPFEGVAVPRPTSYGWYSPDCCSQQAATWTPPAGWLAVSMDVGVMLMDILAKDWGKLVTDSLKLAKDCGLNVQSRRMSAPAPGAIHWWGLFSDVLAIAAALRSGDPAVINAAIQKFLIDLGL